MPNQPSTPREATEGREAAIETAANGVLDHYFHRRAKSLLQDRTLEAAMQRLSRALSEQPQEGEREALQRAADALKQARNGLDLGLGAMRSLKGDEPVYPTDAEVRLLDGFLKDAHKAHDDALAALATPSNPPEDTRAEAVADHVIDEHALVRASYTARTEAGPTRDRELIRAYVRESALDEAGATAEKLREDLAASNQEAQNGAEAAYHWMTCATALGEAAQGLLDAIEHARTTTDPVEWTFRDDDVDAAKAALIAALSDSDSKEGDSSISPSQFMQSEVDLRAE